MSKTKKEKEVLLTYAGIRESDGKSYHLFYLGKKEYLWSKAKYGEIGNRYKAVDDGDSLKLNSDLMKVNAGKGNFDKKTIEEWELKEKIAEQRLRDIRASKRAKNLDKHVSKYTEPLHEKYKKLKGFEERKAFLNYIERLIHRGSKTLKKEEDGIYEF